MDVLKVLKDIGNSEKSFLCHVCCGMMGQTLCRYRRHCQGELFKAKNKILKRGTPSTSRSGESCEPGYVDFIPYELPQETGGPVDRVWLENTLDFIYVLCWYMGLFKIWRDTGVLNVYYATLYTVEFGNALIDCSFYLLRMRFVRILRIGTKQVHRQSLWISCEKRDMINLSLPCRSGFTQTSLPRCI